MIGTNSLPISGVLHQVLEQPDEGHGGGHRLLAGAVLELVVHRVGRQRERLGADDPPRQVPAQGGAPLLHVLDLVGVLARVVVGRQLGLQRRVRDLQVQPVAELLQLGDRQLLHLVGGVAALEVGPERPALDGVRQDHRRLADVLGRGLERRVHLAVVVPAPGQVADLVVGQVRHHRAQPGVGAEEVLPGVGAALDRVGLELAVRRGVHLVHQHAVGVLRQQRVPVPAPDHLDDVPARAAEGRLQLLDDLPVAADRPVQPLQIAVDDEGEVVQFLAGRQPDRAQRLGLVHLAVAEERPHVRPAGVLELPGQQVPVEPGLVDRVDPAQAHGHGGELPEVRHEPRVRVGGQAAARMRELLAESVELLLGQPSLQERAGVDARRRVALEEDLVPGLAVVLAAEEVVEPDLIQAGGRGVGGDVAAHAEAGPVGAGHHDGGVPPDIGADAPLGVLVAGEPGLALGRDRVDEVGAAQAGDADLLFPGPLEQAQHDVPRPGPAAGAHDVVERVDPFPGLVRVDVRELRREAVANDREALASSGHGDPAFRDGGRLVAAAGVHGGGRLAAPAGLGCPDQFWYVCPARASPPGPGDHRRSAGGAGTGEPGPPRRWLGMSGWVHQGAWGHTPQAM